jgi:allophanate hydrolase subunit 2
MSLVVVRALGLCTIQDFGRPGHMHEGLSHGGALVRSLLVEANRRAHNPDETAAIEVMGQLVVRATRDVETSAGLVHANTELAITSEPRRVAYLAVRGGVDAPLILGSRSTHLSAGLGSPLRAGTSIEASSAPRLEQPGAPPLIRTHVIRVIPSDAFDPALLTMYRISPSSDRVGTRLDGPKLRATPSTGSRPMVRGAIEVPGDGQPIVLGPEHPTTGGYPIAAVIVHDDLDHFFATRPGGIVQFATEI